MDASLRWGERCGLHGARPQARAADPGPSFPSVDAFQLLLRVVAAPPAATLRHLRAGGGQGWIALVMKSATADLKLGSEPGSMYIMWPAGK